MSDNTITVVGNLTRDPELRFTASGKGVASFGIAVNRRVKVGDGYEDKTSFFNVTAWDSLGENGAASLTKGARVIVTGRLEQREYETKEGEKRQAVEIVADEIGPSLRWATATVARTERTGPGAPAGGRAASSSGFGPEEPFLAVSSVTVGDCRNLAAVEVWL